jgi:hypothetical protein
MEILQIMPFSFYGQTFECFYCDDRRFYLPLVRLCEAIGVYPNPQRQRILSDEAISDGLIVLGVSSIGNDSKNCINLTDCLWLERLPYWQGTIDASRVKPEVKDRVILFKKAFAETAWAVFRSDIVPHNILTAIDKCSSQGQDKGMRGISRRDRRLQRAKVELLKLYSLVAMMEKAN